MHLRIVFYCFYLFVKKWLTIDPNLAVLVVSQASVGPRGYHSQCCASMSSTPRRAIATPVRASSLTCRSSATPVKIEVRCEEKEKETPVKIGLCCEEKEKRCDRSRSPLSKRCDRLDIVDPAVCPTVMLGHYQWSMRARYTHDLRIAESLCRAGVQQDWRYFRTECTFGDLLDGAIAPLIHNISGRVDTRCFYAATQFPHELPEIFPENQYNYILSIGDFDAMWYCGMRLAQCNSETMNAMILKDTIIGNENYTHFLALVVCTRLSFFEEFDPTDFF